jgi:hypothetical protein
MALFQPKTIKNLRLEIMAARIAFTASPKASPDYQARIAATAPREISAAAKAAATAGQSEAARTLLNEELGTPTEACPAGTSWAETIQAGLDALD